MVNPVEKAVVPALRPTQAERTALAEEKMINATIDLLNTVGLAGTTLIAIGESAGYSRGLASHHFGSKSGLFRKVLRHITAVWTEELENNLDGKQGLDALQAALDAHRDHLLHFPHHARAMYILWSASFDPASEFKPNVIEFHRLQRATAAAWVLNGQETGEIRSDVDPVRFAEQFYASLLGLNFQWLVNPDIDLKASFETLKQNIVALLEANQPLKKETK
ncbi:MAG: TetR/AcrR family transcriptional regulator [Lysobacterales bacterium]